MSIWHQPVEFQHLSWMTFISNTFNIKHLAIERMYESNGKLWLLHKWTSKRFLWFDVRFPWNIVVRNSFCLVSILLLVWFLWWRMVKFVIYLVKCLKLSCFLGYFLKVQFGLSGQRQLSEAINCIVLLCLVFCSSSVSPIRCPMSLYEFLCVCMYSSTVLRAL